MPEDSSGGISRRGLIVAGAWSVPVITLAAAAPALAASAQPLPLNVGWANGWPVAGGFGINCSALATPSPDPLAVASQITALIAIPQSLLPTPATATVVATTWVAAGPPTASGSNWVYGFLWQGYSPDNPAGFGELIADAHTTGLEVDFDDAAPLASPDIRVSFTGTNAVPSAASPVTWYPSRSDDPNLP